MLGFMTKDKHEEKVEKNGDVKKYEAVLDDGIDVAPVVKVNELIATSSQGFDDAIQRASPRLPRASGMSAARM